MRPGTDRLWLVRERKGGEKDRKWEVGVGLRCNWMDGGTPRMGNGGVGAGLSVGHEWPGRVARGRWRSGSGAQETYLGG